MADFYVLAPRIPNHAFSQTAGLLSRGLGRSNDGIRSPSCKRTLPKFDR